MKKVLFFLLLSILFQPVFAQKNEWNLSFSSGLFSFRGSGTKQPTFISGYVPNHKSYANPYGTLWCPIVGLSTSIKKVTRSNLLFGVELSYEILRGGNKIVGIADADTVYPTSGKAHINQNFINLFPQFGYRIRVKKVSVDVLLGFDLAYGFGLNGTAKTSTEGRSKLSYNHDNLLDLRPRIQVAVNYRRMSAFIAYAHGLIPYNFDEIGAANYIFAQILRIGVAYRLNK